MRKVFLAVTLAFSLAACATISNPVGTTQLAQIESANVDWYVQVEEP